MPRNHTTGTSQLRNRNRVTNKTRLRIVQGDIDAESWEDSTFLPDKNDTAGVDQEDANEHHLQAVLSAASKRQQTEAQRPTKGQEKQQEKEAPIAIIPVPDSTGLVDNVNYEEWYQPNRWTDPSTFIKSSDTVEDTWDSALNNGFTYLMDERDKEWLDKNNEEARGEGTSAAGACAAATPTTRSGGPRSAKSKGKEAETSASMSITEDEFELVMGLFEKVTHEKAEFLHHSFKEGNLPPFTDYQDTFANPLPPPTFASFLVSEWIPEPEKLCKIAKVVYPHWRQRRTDREGHRIIPSLNFDESDVHNESYICFRRREIKAVRKTRASQASSSDKLTRLHGELKMALDLAQTVLMREEKKKEALDHAQQVWEKRQQLADLKRRFPTLGIKEDEELLFEKERSPKKAKADAARINVKIRTGTEPTSPASHVEPAVRPRERYDALQSAMQSFLQRYKERDVHWEDAIDNPYQSPLTSYAQRQFKFIPQSAPPTSSLFSASTEKDEEPHSPRALRRRLGRGGRAWIDRRRGSGTGRARATSLRRDLRESDSDEDEQGRKERERLLEERWKFDQDDEPAVGPEGAEEQDRVLVDDFSPSYLVHSMRLLSETDHSALLPDPVIIVFQDGHQKGVYPFRQPTFQRQQYLAAQQRGLYLQAQAAAAAQSGSQIQGQAASAQGLVAPTQASPQGQLVAQQQIANLAGSVPQIPAASVPSSVLMGLPNGMITNMPSGTPISVMKKMQPPQMRISSNPTNRPTNAQLQQLQQQQQLHQLQQQQLHHHQLHQQQLAQQAQAQQHSSPPQRPASTASNGISDPNQLSIDGSGDVEMNVQQQQLSSPPHVNLISVQQDSSIAQGMIPVRPKSTQQNLLNQQITPQHVQAQAMAQAQMMAQAQATSNGYHMSGNPALPQNYAQFMPGHNAGALTAEQIQILKATMNNAAPRYMNHMNINAMAMNGNPPNTNGAAGFNMGMTNGSDISLKMPPQRVQRSRPASVVNGAVNGAVPQAMQVPMRTPSTTGWRQPQQHITHSMSPHAQHSSPSPMPQGMLLPQHPSPPKMSSSPLLQHQQAVGGHPQQGY